MEIRCKSAKDVLVGLYFLLAMERMFTSGKNLTQKLDPCFTKGCFLSLEITARISDDYFPILRLKSSIVEVLSLGYLYTFSCVKTKKGIKITIEQDVLT